MADLTTTSASGVQQGGTSNPQAVPGAQSIGGPSKQSGGVQPGTADSVLRSNGGVSLQSSALTTVSLDATASTAAQTSKVSAAKPANHHANGVFIVICIVLVLVAAGLFWGINRSAKSTTD